MGASESSARSNGTEEEEEEERQHENNSSVGSSMAAAATVAAGAAVAVWGISKMLSNNTDTEESNRHVTESPLLSTDRIIYEAHTPRSTWSPPPPGRYKINTDGSCQPTPIGLTGYAGILRDHDGKWVHGFIGSIGVADSFTSELHGIVKGLELLDRLNYKGGILENDHESLVYSVNGDLEESVLACGPDIKKCRQLRVKNRITVEYVRGKGANRCADKLADMARESRGAYVELEFRDLPLEIRKLVQEVALANS